MNYDLDLEKVVRIINKEKAKLVCLQLPDGLKPKATEIVDFLESRTKAKMIVWLNSNWGSCDVPLGLDSIGVDLLINFGHNSFGFKEKIAKKGFKEL